MQMAENIQLADKPQEITPIMRGFQFLQSHFPNISPEKEHFFQELAKLLPNEDPYIQSSDSEYIDVLWGENMLVTLTENNSVSVSVKNDFCYFEPYQHKEAIQRLTCT